MEQSYALPESGAYAEKNLTRLCDCKAANMKDSCKRCKEHHEHVYWEHNERVRFCKTMVGDFSKRVSIPAKFMSRFRGKLPNIVELKGPSDNSWRVGLEESTGSYFLRHGWEEFVEAHHIEENDILFFEFEAKSRFYVLVFDSSECERESSYFSKTENSEKQEEKKEGSLNDREVCDFSSSSSPNGDNIPVESSPSNSYQRGETSCPKRKTKKQQRIVTPKPELSGASLRGNQSEDRSSSKRPATDAEKKAAKTLAEIKRAEITRPSFSVVMKRYNIDSQLQLLIPRQFAKEFLPQKSQEIILRINPCVRKEWKVKYHVSGNAARFIGKWRNFVRDNDLEEGDVCVFKLSNSKKKIAMIVHIFRAVSKEPKEEQSISD